MYGIILYDGVEPIDIGATVGVLSMARRIAPTLQFVTIARRHGEVTCASGLKVVVDHDYDSAPDLTDVIVTGGPGWVDAAQDPATLSFLKKTTARITSICTGAMILAATGLLHDKHATTKSAVFAGETSPTKLLPEKTLVEGAAIVDDHGLVTGGGVSLGIDTMFYCLARSHGQAIADETARVMEYDRARAANRDALGYKIHAA